MEEQEEKIGKTGKRRNLVPVIAVAGVAIVIGGLVATGVISVNGLGGGGEGGGHGGGHGGGEGAAEGGEGEQSGDTGPIIDLAPLVVRLEDEEEVHYLKASVSVELRNAEAEKRYEARKVVARHAVVMALSSLTIADTRGNENREKLRDRLQSQLLEVLGSKTVRAVYFTDFVTQ